MPKLIKFYDDHKDMRDHFEILAFHDSSATSIKEIDEKLKAAKIIDDVWGGRNLPFPVLLDDDRKTIEGWGIRAFPTMVLINPEGKIVKGGSEKMLEEELKAIKARSASN